MNRLLGSIESLFPLFFAPEGDSGGGGDDDHSQDDVSLDNPDDEAEGDETPEGDESGDDQPDGGDDSQDENDPDVDLDNEPDDNPDDEDEADEGDENQDENEDQERNATSVRFADLKKEFPKIFSKFPQLASIIKEERGFREVFGTVDEAKEAAETAEFFTGLESSIMSGDSEQFIDAVKGNPKALENFTLDLIERTRESNDKLYAKITTPAIVGALRYALHQGTSLDNKNLVHAVGYVSKAIWGDTKLPEIGPTKKEGDSAKDDELKQERAKFQSEREKDFQEDVVPQAYGGIEREISGRLDPKTDARLKTLTPYTRNNIIRDIRLEINKRLDNDNSHNRRMQSIAAQARKANFNRESRRQFVSAYLQAAKALVPSASAKILKEAFGDRKKVNNNGDRSNNNTPSKREGQATRPNNGQQTPRVQKQTKRVPSAREVDWSRTTDKMFMNDEYVPRNRR